MVKLQSEEAWAAGRARCPGAARAPSGQEREACGSARRGRGRWCARRARRERPCEACTSQLTVRGFEVVCLLSSLSSGDLGLPFSSNGCVPVVHRRVRAPAQGQRPHVTLTSPSHKCPTLTVFAGPFNSASSAAASSERRQSDVVGAERSVQILCGSHVLQNQSGTVTECLGGTDGVQKTASSAARLRFSARLAMQPKASKES